MHGFAAGEEVILVNGWYLDLVTAAISQVNRVSSHCGFPFNLSATTRRKKLCSLSRILYRCFSAIVSACVLLGCAFADEVVINGVALTIPPNYSKVEGEKDSKGYVTFIKKGDLLASLKTISSDQPINAEGIASFFGKDFLADLQIAVFDLPEKEQSLRLEDLAPKFQDGFIAHWGRGAFSVVLEKPYRIWLVNTLGAFIARTFQTVDDKMVVVQAIDVVNFAISEKSGRFQKADESPASNWELVKKAANAQDAERLLRSARRVR